MVTTSDNWLDDIAILNESIDYNTPSDVEVFRTLDDMCLKLEHWFVEEQCGYALTASGKTIKLTTDGKRVFASICADSTKDQNTVHLWLYESAKHLRHVRIEKSKKTRGFFRHVPTIGPAERKGALPNTIEGLLAYIAMS